MTSKQSRIPPPPGEEEIPIHTRTYSVNTYRIDGDTMRLRGRVTDTKPAGLYIPGDTEPLDVHDMSVDLIVAYPSLVISSVEVILDTHPNTDCPSIEPAFGKLKGVSIARGFNRQLTELLGGPRGCTHVVALLRAMVPVAIQSLYSMQAADPERDVNADWKRERLNKDAAIDTTAFVLDSCHVWASGGERMTAVQNGEPMGAPVWIEDRLTKLGRDDELSKWQ